MEDRERIDRLEAQVSRLQAEFGNLVRAIDLARAADPAVVSRTAVPAVTPAPTVTPAPATAPVPEASPAGPLPREEPAGRDLESWFGENALLVVGVLALVASVGFALKYAFEQGWVSPQLRVLAGLLFGALLAAYGARARRRGLARFGAAAIGAGAAIAYLAIWAAAGPYAFIPSIAGVAALAVVSSLVLLTAWRSDEPYLAAMAATGAYFAPILLGDASTSPNLLLGYTALISAAAGPIAVLRGWRVTAAIVIAGYFWPAVLASGRADAAWVALYLAGGGAIAVAATRVAGWRMHEAAAWAAAWLGLALTASAAADWRGWAYVAAPALLVAPGWLAALRGGGRPWRLALSASLWVFVALIALPQPADADPLAVIGLIGALYAAPGLARRIPALLSAGVGVLAIGMLAQWEGADANLGWALLVAAVAITTAREPLSRVRWTGVALGSLAFLRLVLVDTVSRPDAAPAFLDRWALAWYALLVALVLLASIGWKDREARIVGSQQIDLLVVAWLLAGMVLLVGGTIELARVFDQQLSQSSALAALASGLAVSVFWLLYAGGLLVYGFRRDQRAVRITGLIVATLAIAKVALYDLANLEALYRVASFALLAAIALLGAHAYHRRAGRPRRAGGATPLD